MKDKIKDMFELYKLYPSPEKDILVLIYLALAIWSAGVFLWHL